LNDKNTFHENLKREYKEKETELDGIDTQVLLMSHEIITKEGEKNRLTQELNERKIQEENMVRPKIQGLEKDIDMLNLEIIHKKNALENCKVEKVSLNEGLEIIQSELIRLDKEVVDYTKDANEKKSDPKSYNEYKSILEKINSKLTKEKNDLQQTIIDKDKKIVDIKENIERIKDETLKLENIIAQNQEEENKKNEELELIIEEIKKLMDDKQLTDNKLVETMIENKKIKEKLKNLKSNKDKMKKLFLTMVKDLKREEN